jgi:hypothetical protein
MSNTLYLSGDKWELSGWLLSSLQPTVIVEVIAPTQVPVKAGDRVKKNRWDALIRRCDSNMDTGLQIRGAPGSGAGTRGSRARVPADRSSPAGWKQGQLRPRARLSKFLLRTGQRSIHGMMAWTQSRCGCSRFVCANGAGGDEVGPSA